MKLSLIRHGVAHLAAPGQHDRARALTPKGKRKLMKAALGLRTVLSKDARLFSSPARRATETTKIIRKICALSAIPRKVSALAPGTQASKAKRFIERLAPGKDIVLIGHEPQLGELAALLLFGVRLKQGRSVSIKKGGLCQLQISPDGSPRLTALLGPTMLRKLGRNRS